MRIPRDFKVAKITWHVQNTRMPSNIKVCNDNSIWYTSIFSCISLTRFT